MDKILTIINWKEYSQENLEKEYSDYIERIQKDHTLNIVTNVLCMVNYSKPKINNGINRDSKVEYVNTRFKIMTSTLLIKYDSYQEKVIFIFGNCTPLKFFKMEDI